MVGGPFCTLTIQLIKMVPWALVLRLKRERILQALLGKKTLMKCYGNEFLTLLISLLFSNLNPDSPWVLSYL